MSVVFCAISKSCLKSFLYSLLQISITVLLSFQFPGQLFVHSICLKFALPVSCPGLLLTSSYLVTFLIHPKHFCFRLFYMSTHLWKVNSDYLSSTPYADLICVWLGYCTLVPCISPWCSSLFIKKQIWSI